MATRIIRSLKSDLSYELAKNEIFSDEEFLSELEETAKKKSISKDTALAQANLYFGKIAAKITKSSIFWALSKFTVKNKIIAKFDNIYVNKEYLKKLPDLMKDNIITFVPNHKSVFDFMLIPYYIVTEIGFMPIILAADVFEKFPLGIIFRKMGAYFICRGDKDEIYNLVFKHYVMRIVRYELIHFFFIEGGRNKSGGYSEPKTGLLHYILQGRKRFNDKKDIIFIPVSISYDYVAESKIVIKENLTGQRKNIFRSIAKYGSRRNMGNCYLRFNEPIKLSSVQKSSLSEADTVNALAGQIMSSIKNNIAISPIMLVCYTLNSIIKDVPAEITFDEFFDKYNEFLAYLKKVQKDTYIHPDKIREYLQFSSDFGIFEYDNSAGKISVPSENKPLIEYYSNGIAHFFG